MKFEIIDLDGLAVVAHVEHGEVWFFLDELSKEFSLQITDFLAWPKVEEFLSALMLDRGLTNALDTKEFFTQFVRSVQEPPYRGIWLNLPLALEFVSVCSPLLRYRLQQWLACRFAAERQAIDRRIFVEVGHGSTLH